ncbi:TetR/AcrR family transcriptional regulator [Listeria aquatica]|uniref:TetR/AcrR family transcriptional regulator n=1 Tax=Listeria aquatica TaxID=1494960 RepID=UPI003F720E2D
MSISTKTALESAALELFLEKGYSNTTAAEIAEHAGVTERTFFRYYPEKKEILFSPTEKMAATIKKAIKNNSAGSFLEKSIDGFTESMNEFFSNQHALAKQRMQIIRQNSELQERETKKRAVLSSVIIETAIELGAQDFNAKIIANIVIEIFSLAFDDWLNQSSEVPFKGFMNAVKEKYLITLKQVIL